MTDIELVNMHIYQAYLCGVSGQDPLQLWDACGIALLASEDLAIEAAHALGVQEKDGVVRSMRKIVDAARALVGGR